jgi:2-oxoacid:acceptor oxidoreductase delta subunit (pyruvate/2-ketoisovalerate family)
MIKPRLRDAKEWRLSDYPDSASFVAGHLVTKNSGWRSARPVVDPAKCVGCLQCWLYCPDGVIFRRDGKVGVDYDFCKGCGICARMCRPGAVVMEAEA